MWDQTRKSCRVSWMLPEQLLFRNQTFQFDSGEKNRSIISWPTKEALGSRSQDQTPCLSTSKLPVSEYKGAGFIRKEDQSWSKVSQSSVVTTRNSQMKTTTQKLFLSSMSSLFLGFLFSVPTIFQPFGVFILVF